MLLNTVLVQILDADRLLVAVDVGASDAGVAVSLLQGRDGQIWVARCEGNEVLLHPGTNTSTAAVPVAVADDQFFQLSHSSQ